MSDRSAAVKKAWATRRATGGVFTRQQRLKQRMKMRWIRQNLAAGKVIRYGTESEEKK